MIRIVLSVLLLGLLGANATAAIYRCRDANGVLILTDDPANLPAGCRPEEPTDSKGGLSIVPGSPAQPGVPAAREFLREESLRAEARGRQIQVWSEEAESLVKDYQQALTQRYRTTLPSKRSKAFGRIREIKERRDELLKELAKVRLSPKERDPIEKTLAVIPP